MDGIRAGSPERSIASEQTAVMNASECKFKWSMKGYWIYIYIIYVYRYYVYIYTRTYVGMYIMMCLCRSIYIKNHIPGCMCVCVCLLIVA